MKERARLASLLPRMLPLCPDDPGAPGVTPLASPFSVTGVVEEDTELAATLELEFCCGEELAQLLLAVLLPLFRGVAPADAEMLFALWPIVPLSQSLPLLVAVPVAAGALVLSLRLGVAISAVCTAFRFCWFGYFRSPSFVTFTTAHSSVYPTFVFLLSRFAIFFWVFPLDTAIALAATT